MAKLSTRHGGSAKVPALHLARYHNDQSLRELGALVGGMQNPAVTMAIRRFEQRLGPTALLAKKIKRLCKMLHVKT